MSTGYKPLPAASLRSGYDNRCTSVNTYRRDQAVKYQNLTAKVLSLPNERKGYVFEFIRILVYMINTQKKQSKTKRKTMSNFESC